MKTFEYKVIPAPKRGKSGKGVRGNEAKFVNALSAIMNEMGADGWDYVRADTLPCDERSGLTSRTTVYHNVLVFRKATAEPEQDNRPAPLVLTHPITASPVPDITAEDAAWRKFAMEDEGGFEDPDPSVVDLLSARKARDTSPSPAAARTAAE